MYSAYKVLQEMPRTQAALHAVLAKMSWTTRFLTLITSILYLHKHEENRKNGIKTEQIYCFVALMTIFVLFMGVLSNLLKINV